MTSEGPTPGMIRGKGGRPEVEERNLGHLRMLKMLLNMFNLLALPYTSISQLSSDSTREYVAINIATLC